LSGSSRPPTRPIHVSALALLLAGLAAAGAARAADSSGESALVRGEELARQGRCDEAQEQLARIPDASPLAARAALASGQCWLKAQRFPEAAAAFERASRLEPEKAQSQLWLGIARFHQGDTVRARAALDAAQPALGDRAEWQLYDGLLRLQAADSEAAAASLSRARRTDPAAVEPVASYYEGVAWASSQDRDEAEQALRRVQTLAPGTPWADEAGRALAALGPEEEAWWVTLRAGIEYDDNVVLLADGVARPRDISSAHDVSAAYYVNAGYEYWRTRDWSAGVMLTYYGEDYQDLEDFDTQYPVGSLWLDHRFAEDTTGRLRYDIGYAWVGGSEPFLFNQGATAALYQGWDRWGRTDLYASFYLYDYLYPESPDAADQVPGAADFSTCTGPAAGAIVCSPFGIDESRERNRDGPGTVLGIDHTIGLPFQTELTAGYAWGRFSARGSEYSQQSHEFHLRTLTLLPWRISLDTWASYAYEPYRNASTFPNPREVFRNVQYPLQSERRRDDVYRLAAGVERPIVGNLSGSIRYSYTKYDSNVAVFAYDREVTGAYLTYRFHP
jgi:tetratricopeptide (TPR) repeat protein